MKNVFYGLAAGAGAVFAAFQVRGALLRFRPETVPIPGLDPAADGLRIAVLSDLHDRRFGKNGKRLVSFLRRSRADLILLAGDMHAVGHDPAPFYALLKDLRKIAPVLYVDGNHDPLPETAGNDVCAAHRRRMEDCGVTLLNGQKRLVRCMGKPVLTVCGKGWSDPAPRWDPSLPSVLLCHDPLNFDRLDPLPDLMISGHVHGGLIKLPWIGPVFAPGNGVPLYKRFTRSCFFPKYSEGLYFRGTHCLSVSRGLGFSVLPVRFYPAEVPLLTLRSAEKPKKFIK